MTATLQLIPLLGFPLVERLLSQGVDIKCLVRRGSNLTWLKNLPVTLVAGDYHDPASLAPAVKLLGLGG